MFVPNDCRPKFPPILIRRVVAGGSVATTRPAVSHSLPNILVGAVEIFEKEEACKKVLDKSPCAGECQGAVQDPRGRFGRSRDSQVTRS